MAASRIPVKDNARRGNSSLETLFGKSRICLRKWFYILTESLLLLNCSDGVKYIWSPVFRPSNPHGSSLRRSPVWVRSAVCPPAWLLEEARDSVSKLLQTLPSTRGSAPTWARMWRCSPGAGRGPAWPGPTWRGSPSPPCHGRGSGRCSISFHRPRQDRTETN